MLSIQAEDMTFNLSPHPCDLCEFIAFSDTALKKHLKVRFSSSLGRSCFVKAIIHVLGEVVGLNSFKRLLTRLKPLSSFNLSIAFFQSAYFSNEIMVLYLLFNRAHQLLVKVYVECLTQIKEMKRKYFTLLFLRLSTG